MGYTKEDLYTIKSNLKGLELKLKNKLNEDYFTLDWIEIEGCLAVIQICLNKNKDMLWTHLISFNVHDLNDKGSLYEIVKEKCDWHRHTITRRIEHDMYEGIVGKRNTINSNKSSNGNLDKYM